MSVLILNEFYCIIKAVISIPYHLATFMSNLFSNRIFTYCIQTLNEENIAYGSFLAVKIFNPNYIVPRGPSIDDNSAITLWGVWPHTASGALHGALMDYSMHTIFPIMVKMKVHMVFIQSGFFLRLFWSKFEILKICNLAL